MHNSPPSFVGLGLHGARLPPSSRECHQLYCPDQRALSLSLCQAFCPPILFLATEQWPSSLPEHYMVPSGRSKDRYLPLPVPYTCPHNPAPPLYLHATTRCEHAPSRKPPRLKLQAVSPPAPRQSGDTPPSRWAWALLAPCYACLHDATGTRTCHAAVIPP